MLGVWRRPACSVQCVAAPPVGLWGTRWPVVQLLPQAGRPALTSPRSLRAVVRHHSTTRDLRLGEARWTARVFGAGAQRQPHAAGTVQRHQWHRWHHRQWRSCATTATSPPSAVPGDESRRREAGAAEKRKNECVCTFENVSSLGRALGQKLGPKLGHKRLAQAWADVGVVSAVVAAVISIASCELTPMPPLAAPPNSYLKKHEQLMSQSDALLSLSNSRRAIWASIAGGTLVFAGKLCVVMYCGGMGEASDSIVAETAHSFVDVLNQVFLLVGIQRSQRPVSDLHPRGTTRELYTWSLLSCVVLFLSGSCFSVYIGVDSLMTPHEPAEINIALGTMALSAAVESTTLWIAYKSVAKAAKKMHMSVSEYVKHGPDQTAVSVMAQDIVSVSALLWATVALSASSATGNAAFDAVGSIGVGIGLGWLAYYLGFRNIALLNGHSIPAHQISALKKMLNGDAVVDKAYNLKADYLGPGNVAVSADIDFEGRAITRRFIERDRSLECLAKWKPGMLLAERTAWFPPIGESAASERDAAEEEAMQSLSHEQAAHLQAQRKQQVLSELRQRLAAMTDEEFQEFLEAFGDAIVDSTSREVDRLEVGIKSILPDARTVDFETH